MTFYDRLISLWHLEIGPRWRRCRRTNLAVAKTGRPRQAIVHFEDYFDTASAQAFLQKMETGEDKTTNSWFYQSAVQNFGSQLERYTCNTAAIFRLTGSLIEKHRPTDLMNECKPSVRRPSCVPQSDASLPNCFHYLLRAEPCS
jgi:hypothetical protein